MLRPFKELAGDKEEYSYIVDVDYINKWARELLDGLLENKKIQVVRALRNLTMIGLKEGKDIADSYIGNHSRTCDELNKLTEGLRKENEELRKNNMKLQEQNTKYINYNAKMWEDRQHLIGTIKVLMEEDDD